jgi:ribosomal protein S18 acetylase RimI-like enzyme
MNCRIIYKDNKIDHVQAENGERSILFDSLKDIFGAEKALELYALTEEDGYKQKIQEKVRSFVGVTEKQIDKLSEVIEQPSDAKFSKAEMQAIKDKAIADGTFMKAPNGQPTNLNEQQWLQVRTEAFKDWSKNWSEVILDDNKEPKVYYHNSKVDGITEFKIAPSNDDLSTGGFFASPSKTFNFNNGVNYPIFIGYNNAGIFDKEDFDKYDKFLEEVFREYQEDFLSTKLDMSDIEDTLNARVFISIPSILERKYKTEIKKQSKSYKIKPVYDEFGDFLENMSPESQLFEDFSNFRDKNNELNRAYNLLEDISRRHKLFKDYVSIERNGNIIKNAGFKGAYVFESKIQNIQLYSINGRVKSATENIGTFSTETNDIRFSAGENQGQHAEREVIDRLKQNGLANNVFEMNTQEINAKLEELGVDAETRKQVIEHQKIKLINQPKRGENAFTITYDNIPIGDLDLLYDSGKWVIDNIGINEDYRNKGIGTLLYLKAVEKLPNNEALYSSGFFEGGDAIRVWDSLTKKGLAQKIGEEEWVLTKQIQFQKTLNSLGINLTVNGFVVKELPSNDNILNLLISKNIIKKIC